MIEHKKILVVDDEPSILSLTARMVQMAGLETLLANNAEEAIQIYKEKSEDFGVAQKL